VWEIKVYFCPKLRNVKSGIKKYMGIWNFDWDHGKKRKLTLHAGKCKMQVPEIRDSLYLDMFSHQCCVSTGCMKYLS
jgi:hypothetical protein